MRKLRHRKIVQLADVLEPESELRLFDSRVTTPHEFFLCQETALGGPMLDRHGEGRRVLGWENVGVSLNTRAEEGRS